MWFSAGVFARLYNWVTDAAAGVKIRADRMDAEMDGMATGLSTCVLKDGTQIIRDSSKSIEPGGSLRRARKASQILARVRPPSAS